MLTKGTLISDEFEVLRPLARGGMGAVYLVRQLSTNALRALKVMQPSLQDDPEATRRFEREARVGALIQSDHVVEVVAAGTHGNVPWIAMERLEGLTLSSALDTWGPPHERDGDLVLRQLFHAVSAAHVAQVVHRDLKPENIFLTQLRTPGGGFSVKVLDFGIAKWLGTGSSTAALGTWNWAAPEQGLAVGQIGYPTDVWALGLIVFWLLTGQSFWLPRGGQVAILSQVHLTHIPPASTRAKELNSSCEFDQAFDSWFGRCVAREMEHRFPNAGAAWLALSKLELPWNPHATAWRITNSTHIENTGSMSPARISGNSETSLPPATSITAAGGGMSVKSTGARRWTRLGPGAVGVLGLSLAGYFGWPRLQALVKPSALVVSDTPAATPATLTMGMRRITGEQSRAPALLDGDLTPGTSLGVADFWLDANEVSVEEYQACVNQKQCTAAELTDTPDVTPELARLCNAAPPVRERHPINCVNWYQALGFCSARGKRLPTAQEWQWVAGGAEHRSYPWGNTLPSSCDEAVVSGLCARQPTATREVGSRSTSTFTKEDIHDLAGNVWEWVSDDARGGSALGALYGGGWDYPRERATSTSRIERSKQFADVSTGFRCAL